MSLFSSVSDIEKELEELYTPMFSVIMQMSNDQAKKAACDIIKQIKEEQKQEGTGNVPKNFSDYLLEKEKIDEKIKIKFSKKRQEGVRDEDIKWWFNLHDLKRRMLLKVDDIIRLTMFKHFKQGGKNSEEAVMEIRKYQPMYGDPDDTTHTSGEDRPLPYELKDRINKYIVSRTGDREKLKIELLRSSSFNAYIREKIRKGNL